MIARGDLVTIYEDPLTMQKPEGQAKLIRFLRIIEPGIEQHLVHFVGDAPGKNVERIIVIDNSQ